MTLDLQQFADHVLIPTLQDFQLFSPAAVILLLGTAMVESDFKYIHQIGGGPAIGLYQMEPATHDDIWINYIKYHPHLHDDVMMIGRESWEMHGNLYYATLMCRLHYRRFSEPLPLITEHDMARYHKKYYNTAGGHTNVIQSTRVFKRIIEGAYI